MVLSLGQPVSRDPMKLSDLYEVPMTSDAKQVLFQVVKNDKIAVFWFLHRSIGFIYGGSLQQQECG